MTYISVDKQVILQAVLWLPQYTLLKISVSFDFPHESNHYILVPRITPGIPHYTLVKSFKGRFFHTKTHCLWVKNRVLLKIFTAKPVSSHLRPSLPRAWPLLRQVEFQVAGLLRSQDRRVCFKVVREMGSGAADGGGNRVFPSGKRERMPTRGIDGEWE